MADFAVRLRQLRKERGLRQLDLATELGIAQTTIANYEQHTRFPDEAMLLRLAAFFETSLDFLLGRSDVNIHPGTLAASASVVSPAASSLSPLATRYLHLVRDGESGTAVDLILDAVRAGTPVRTIYVDVLEACLRVVGTLWETNEMDISEEHYFSEATESLMARLRPYLAAGPEKKGTAVLTAAGAEAHLIGIQMVGDLLPEIGWTPYYLGGNIPIEHVHRAVSREDAGILAVSATMPAHVDSVVHMIEYVRAHRRRSARVPFFVIVGGAPFNMDPGLWKRVGADGAARNCVETLQLVERLTATVTRDSVGPAHE